MSAIGGLLAALVTPFSSDGAALDESALRSLVDRTVAGGVHGVVPCGSTGEFAAMTPDERRRAVEIVCDQAAGRVPVVAHVGAMTTREAVILARHAEQAGADAVMAVAPYYEPLAIGEITSYFLAIADAVAVPIVVYNLPIATGVNLTPLEIADLARAANNIRYVKDTTGDISQTATLVHDYGEEVGVLVGWDTLYFAALVEGAAGSINGAANIIAPQLRSINDDILAGDVGRARATWKLVFPLMKFLVSGGYVAAVREALDILGHSAGPARHPIAKLEGERKVELETLLKALLGP